MTAASDPLAPLMELEGVADATNEAIDALSAVHRHKVNLRKHNLTGAESVLRGARASAWLAGGRRDLPDDGHVTDPVLAASLRTYEPLAPETISETARIWQRAPLQVLAKFALVADGDSKTSFAQAQSSPVGQPVGDDKLSAAMKEQRLHLLGRMITGGTQVNGVVLSGVIHGEILTMRPFAANNGLIARAASRLASVTTGIDPRGLGVPEVYWTRHKQNYEQAAEAFVQGTPEGVRQWLIMHAEGLTAGATEARGIAQAV